MDKNFLIKIAQCNQDIIHKGFYNPGKMRINIETKNGYTYTPKQLKEIEMESIPKVEDSHILIMKAPTVSALCSKGISNIKTGVLNFASAKHPGGGYLRGTFTQEESLCYCSNLYETIKDSFMYDINMEEKNPEYSDYMIGSEVCFFRNSDLSFREIPIKAMVITSPAVNVKDMKNKKMPIKNTAQIMEKRMEYILKLFAENDCKRIILGAFGCGVFGNNPEEIAEIWRYLLNDKGYVNYFTEVIFAIYDKNLEDTNYKVFEKTFS